MTLRENFLGILFFLCFSMLFSAYTSAAVVLNGTRIIYNETSKEKNIQFTNNGDTPFAVQVWIEEPTEGEQYFITTPEIFRIEAHFGQVVRIISINDLKNQLPDDRESIFYFNFSQIPASFTENENTNQLALLVNSRIKMFYRPKNIIGQNHNLVEQLTINKMGNKLQIANNSPFYVMVLDAEIITDNQEYSVAYSAMLSPKSTDYWELPKGINSADIHKIRLNIINDYGASEIWNKNIN